MGSKGKIRRPRENRLKDVEGAAVAASKEKELAEEKAKSADESLTKVKSEIRDL